MSTEQRELKQRRTSLYEINKRIKRKRRKHGSTKTDNVCESCGEQAHDFEIEEEFQCIPPLSVLRFGVYDINKDYRQALYEFCPKYNSEEIVGSYLGYNPYFPSQDDWISHRDDPENDCCTSFYSKPIEQPLSAAEASKLPSPYKKRKRN